jgi:hypothetical protein
MNYHPLLDLAATVLISAAIIGLTPASSPLRAAIFPVLAALSWHCVAKCPEYVSRSAWASSVGGYTLSYLQEGPCRCAARQRKPGGTRRRS